MDGSEYADNPPKPMTAEDIRETVAEFAAAAKRAIEAGFDGVEIHGTFCNLTVKYLYLPLLL